MHCPNCGTETTTEQRYCRSCGLNLEKIAELVAEQLPAKRDPGDLEKRGWRPLAERTGFGFLVGAGVIGVAAILWKIVTQLMIAKGQYLAGAIFFIVILALVIGGSLLALSNSETHLKKRAPSQPDSLPEAEPTSRLLGEPGLESVPSVTERTTDLLAVDKKGGRG